MMCVVAVLRGVGEWLRLTPRPPLPQDMLNDGEEAAPPVLHDFDLDDAPADGDEDEFAMSDDDEEGSGEDGFGPDSDEDEEDGEAGAGGIPDDSAFDSDEEADGDVDMEGGGVPPHLRPNGRASDAGLDEDEDGAITTNLADDLTNDGFTLPAVDAAAGEADEVEEGVSLKDVEARMRWLVGVLTPREDTAGGKGKSKGGALQGVPGKSRSDHLLQLQHDIANYFGYNTFLVGKLMGLFPVEEVRVRAPWAANIC